MCGICFNILIYTRMKSENLSLYFHHPGHETLSELLSNYSTLCGIFSLHFCYHFVNLLFNLFFLFLLLDKQHIEYGERNQGISLNHLYIFPSLYYMIKVSLLLLFRKNIIFRNNNNNC